MVVLTFDRRRFNYVMGDSCDYFLLSVRQGEPLLIRNRCPHRGGPLHLGHFDGSRGGLICPWHGMEIRDALLRRMALPMITKADTITVVLDESPDIATPVSRIVLANMTCGKPQEGCTRNCDQLERDLV